MSIATPDLAYAYLLSRSSLHRWAVAGTTLYCLVTVTRVFRKISYQLATIMKIFTYKATNWQHRPTHQPATSPVCKMLYCKCLISWIVYG